MISLTHPHHIHTLMVEISKTVSIIVTTVTFLHIHTPLIRTQKVWTKTFAIDEINKK